MFNWFFKKFMKYLENVDIKVYDIQKENLESKIEQAIRWNHKFKNGIKDFIKESLSEVTIKQIDDSILNTIKEKYMTEQHYQNTLQPTIRYSNFGRFTENIDIKTTLDNCLKDMAEKYITSIKEQQINLKESFDNYIKSEEFIDRIIDRIMRKQLGVFNKRTKK